MRRMIVPLVGICLLASTAAAAPGLPVCDRARFLPASGPSAGQVVGGWFEGSNTSRTEGFTVLGKIAVAPAAGEWGEVKFPANHRVYRWIRYVGPPGSHAQMAEIELYAGERKLTGKGSSYGPIATEGRYSFAQAFDENPKTSFRADESDGAYVGADLREAATARRPTFTPAPAAGGFDAPLEVALKSPTPGAVVKYTLDGGMPSAANGIVYKSPIKVEHNASIQAVAILPDHAPSPPSAAVYLVGADRKPAFKTFHLGNSLTQTTGMFAMYASTAGRPHEAKIFARPGAWTKELWDVGLVKEKERWNGLWNALDRVDHLTLQPRDFNIAEEAGYDRKFIEMFHAKSPDVQPWLYCEWVEKVRARPTDRGQVPSRQMTRLVPALTWEESMGAMLLYVEDLRETLVETPLAGKRPRVLPTALAMGWVKNQIDAGKFPGLKPGDFYPTFFNDQVHPTVSPLNNAQGNGGYLVDLTWYAAFYGESPEGKVLPVGTSFTPEQALALQRLAWDVIKNYPDCGLYEVGTEAASPPKIAADGGRVTLSSATPGAWFRYTLDGSAPTRTRGYVYCGAISLHPGMTLKAVAYKSGMADSAAAELTMRAK